VVKKRGARTVAPHLVVVCHANRARSPVVAELFRRYAADHQIRPRPRIDSSGLYAEPGQPVLESIQRLLRSRKLEIPPHSSRPFRVDDVGSARFVITFEQEHRRTIVAQRPDLVPRTFTLREIVRLSQSPHWKQEWNGGPDVAARLHAIRPLVEASDDDTPDPATARRRAAGKVLDSLVEDVARVAPVLLGPTGQPAEPAGQPAEPAGYSA